MPEPFSFLSPHDPGPPDGRPVPPDVPNRPRLRPPPAVPDHQPGPRAIKAVGIRRQYAPRFADAPPRASAVDGRRRDKGADRESAAVMARPLDADHHRMPAQVRRVDSRDAVVSALLAAVARQLLLSLSGRLSRALPGAGHLSVRAVRV